MCPTFKILRKMYFDFFFPPEIIGMGNCLFKQKETSQFVVLVTTLKHHSTEVNINIYSLLWPSILRSQPYKLMISKSDLFPILPLLCNVQINNLNSFTCLNSANIDSNAIRLATILLAFQKILKTWFCNWFEEPLME